MVDPWEVGGGGASSVGQVEVEVERKWVAASCPVDPRRPPLPAARRGGSRPCLGGRGGGGPIGGPRPRRGGPAIDRCPGSAPPPPPLPAAAHTDRSRPSAAGRADGGAIVGGRRPPRSCRTSSSPSCPAAPIGSTSCICSATPPRTWSLSSISSPIAAANVSAWFASPRGVCP